jgi:hypothetical protein
MMNIDFAGIHWGTGFQFLTTLFSGGAFSVLFALYLRNRKMTLDAEDLLRGHFGKELTRMAARLDECEKARAELRREINGMHQEINGLHAKLREKSTDNLLILEDARPPSERAPSSLAAARRLKENGDK